MIEDKYSPEVLSKIISVANGHEPADLLIKGGKIVNVCSNEIYQANIAICDKFIAGIGTHYQEGKIVFDVSDKIISPGFIDSHMHIESTMLEPGEYAKAVIKHGTTAIITDPHEIANVMGIDGITHLLDSTTDLPLKVFAMASSCVPSTNLENSGSELKVSQIKEILEHPRVLGLAEMMNSVGVTMQDESCLGKILLAKDKGVVIDGHSPGLSGMALNSYIAAGISTDHEITTLEEALEKLRLGMIIMIREGSSAKNLKDVIPLVSESNNSRFFLVSDDLHPVELVKSGHIDSILRKAVKAGVDPITAIKMVTTNPAGHYQIKGLGSIAPGKIADLVIMDNPIEAFKVSSVVSNGKIIVNNCELTADINAKSTGLKGNSVRFKPFNSSAFQVKADEPKKVRVIEISKNQLVTGKLIEKMIPKNGLIKADTQKDILKIAVIERHNMTGNISVGFIKGFGLEQGALASSVAHDSHNIVVIGTNDEDMECAVKKIKDINGGFVVVKNKSCIGELSLPIAGLMSDKSLQDVVKEDKAIRDVTTSIGCKLSDPFGTLSFLTLPVIPSFKITDIGLVDVEQFKLVSLFVESGEDC